MAKLIIKRKKELFNSMRNIELFLDNSLLGTISNGKTEIFELEPGTYNLRAKIDWCGSRVQEVIIGENSEKIIELAAYKHSNFLLPALIIAGIIGVLSSYVVPLDLATLALFILIPSLLYMLYHLTLGKDEYLQLRQVN